MPGGCMLPGIFLFRWLFVTLTDIH